MTPGVPAVRPAVDPDGLLLDGIAESPEDPGAWSVVRAHSGLRFLPDTSVLLPTATIGAGAHAPAAALESAPAAQDARSWLAAGTVPGPEQLRDLSTRALLDLRLALQPNGALPAGPITIWRLVWPRDASWAAAALAVTGHSDDCARILRFLARVQHADGTWDARTLVDGSGRAPDARGPQIDAVGWFAWGVWMWHRAQSEDSAAGASIAAVMAIGATPAPARAAATRTAKPLPDDLWRAVRAAANAAVRALGPDDLPVPSGDYWEVLPATTIGNCAILQAGLRAAAELAGAVGDLASAADWSRAADALGAAVDAGFGPSGYPRMVDAPNDARADARNDDRSGAAPGTTGNPIVDAAVTWLGPPFAPPRQPVARAVAHAALVLTVSDGGIAPGRPAPGVAGEAWTPETAFFALYDASTGDRAGALARLAWLSGHRTGLGSLAERVGPPGQAISVAPLAWTNAAVLLALSALDRPLPIPGWS